jgi:hypothetical protein
MELSHPTTIGAHHGLQCGQFVRVDELNNRIFGRMEGIAPVRPNLTFRSAPTRCCNIFPIVDPRKMSRVQLIEGDTWISPYTKSVNIESELRNQYHALQHGADGNLYVPSSSSDLYHVPVAESSNKISNECLYLNHQETYTTTGNRYLEQSNVGKDRFHNNTKLRVAS